MSNLEFFTRLRLLGVLSLVTLFFGGLILVFIGVNSVTTVPWGLPSTTQSDVEYGDGRPFRFGAHLSTDAWLTFVGIGLTLVSYGFSEAYLHLLDWWYSGSKSSLGYRRCHSTLKGLRRLHLFMGPQYVLPLVCIAGLMGHTFGIILVDVWSSEVLDPDGFYIFPPKLKGVSDGHASPWLTDTAGLRFKPNQAFVHQFPPARDFRTDIIDLTGAYPREPPQRIAMTGVMLCPTAFQPFDFGDITSREIVMVANMTEEHGSFEMTRDHTGWMRTQTSNRDWFTDQPRLSINAVVDYRIVEPGKVQIQWARLGPWASNDCDGDSSIKSEPVARRLTYEMHYAVAEVKRGVVSRECDQIFGINILSHDDSPLVTERKDGSLPNFWNWVDAIISDEDSHMIDGVSAFVRAVMAGLVDESIQDFDSSALRLLATGDEPLGPENATSRTRLLPHGFSEYPFFSGQRMEGSTGCSSEAASVFLVLGCIALIVTLMRIWFGPAALPAWIGQHGYTLIEEKPGNLAAGY
ncbi:hypothetical protein B0T10DRAFT_500808 [Thelonectria olida]|uniref:Uncharacterized protein n=1 Tax=Thelonectria olida TaxID=1576542 RepID=A0A9P8VQV8_9HYPO|nr:hypothetical protein B0T10DRAFT_500808 [Thelonectria olida]